MTVDSWQKGRWDGLWVMDASGVDEEIEYWWLGDQTIGAGYYGDENEKEYFAQHRVARPEKLKTR